jgi:hypothetical protein
MERVRVSQPAEIYWRIGAKPFEAGVVSWAIVGSGHVIKIKQRSRGEKSRKIFMDFGSQYNNADPNPHTS